MAKNDILISVIIPAYNSSASIKDAVNSVISQSNRSNIKEIIIVNDGSKDNTSRIVKNIIENNKTSIPISLIEQKNMGVSAARNNGIKVSKGNWIGLLDADDTWLPNKISEQIIAIKKHPEIKAIGSNRDSLFKKHGKKINDKLHKLDVADQLFSYWPSTPTLLINKDTFIKVGMYDESRSYAEDGDLLLRLSSEYGVYYLQDSLIKTADKPAYGHSGLSANNKLMHQGSLQNVKNSRHRNEINYAQFIFFCAWERLKYIRRIIITTLNSLIKRRDQC